MKLLLLAMPVFLSTIIVEAWIARAKGRRIYDIPDAITSLQLGVMSQIAGLFLTTMLWVGIYLGVYEKFRAVALPIDSAWVWILALLAYDFCAYWAHRMDHEVNILWASHVVHHSSEYYNLSTALRQSSTNVFLHWIFYIPLAVMGVPPAVFFTVSLFHLLYQYWVHTELVGRLGVLDRIFVTPSNHRVHHGQNDYCIDKNYGGFLVIWDRLFGTFADERQDEKIIYGSRTPLQSFNPLWGNFHTLAGLWQASRAAQGWGARLGVWLAPPGGWETHQQAHFAPEGFVRFSANTTAHVRWYVLVQYALYVPLVMHLVAIAPELTLASKAAYAGLIVASLLSLGMLLEGRGFSQRLEQLRLLGLGLAFTLAPNWFGLDVPVTGKLGFLLCMGASAFWLHNASRQAPTGAVA